MSGRAVLIGFPQDEGVRRNGGRGGAALVPREIRQWLYRLTAWDPQADVDLAALPPLDVGDVRQAGMEEMQNALAEVVAEVLRRGGVPIVLGGGHETAYGHYLGYVAAQR
jgi:formiminoglutamase